MGSPEGLSHLRHRTRRIRAEKLPPPFFSIWILNKRGRGAYSVQPALCVKAMNPLPRLRMNIKICIFCPLQDYFTISTMAGFGGELCGGGGMYSPWGNWRSLHIIRIYNKWNYKLLNTKNCTNFFKVRFNFLMYLWNFETFLTFKR